jgi:hypothetical protein
MIAAWHRRERRNRSRSPRADGVPGFAASFVFLGNRYASLISRKFSAPVAAQLSACPASLLPSFFWETAYESLISRKFSAPVAAQLSACPASLFPSFFWETAMHPSSPESSLHLLQRSSARARLRCFLR